MSFRTNIFIPVVGGIVLASAPTSFAAPLPELLASLLTNHDRIQVAVHRKEAATHDVGQSRASLLPSLDLTTDSGIENINREYGGNSDEWRYRATIRANQLLTDFGRTRAEVDRSQAMEERARVEWQVVQQNVLLEGATAYLNLVRARERLVRARESVVSIKMQVSFEERLRDQGAGLSSDVLQAKAQLAGAQAAVSSFEGELFEASNRFQNVFYFLPEEKDIRGMVPPGYIEVMVPASVQNALATGMASNSLLLFAKQEVVLAEKELQGSKRMLWPRLEFFAEADHRQDDDGSPGYRTDLAAGVQFTANLFRGNGDMQKIAAAQSRLHAAERNMAFVRRQVEEQVRNAWDLYNVTGSKASHLQDQAINLDEFLRLARKERTMGTRSLLDVLNAEVAAMSAQSSAAAAKVDRIVQACKLLHAMGVLSVKTFQQ